MTPYFHYVSAPPIILSCLVHMFLGMVWYSPLFFGRAFLRIAHPGKSPKPDPRAMGSAIIGTIISMPFFVMLLAAVDARSAGEAALWGLALGFFFDTGLNVSHGFFEDRPFALFVMHRGYHLVSLTLIGAMLGALCGDK